MEVTKISSFVIKLWGVPVIPFTLVPFVIKVTPEKVDTPIWILETSFPSTLEIAADIPVPPEVESSKIILSPGL